MIDWPEIKRITKGDATDREVALIVALREIANQLDKLNERYQEMTMLRGK